VRRSLAIPGIVGIVGIVFRISFFWSVGCVAAQRPKVEPPPPPVEPPPPLHAEKGRSRLVGLMCPRGAVGRPALAALAEREPRAWIHDPAALRRAIALLRTPEVAVLGFDGHRAGWFTLAGLVESPFAPAAAIGAYAGSLPCADELTASLCQAVSQNCGVAIGSPDGDDPTPVMRPGACVDGKDLVVDVDGDGRPEAFDVQALARLEEEVTGGPARAPCETHFSLAAGHNLDILAVADLDGDGRVEIVVSRRGDPIRKVALYTAETNFRLTRISVFDIR
jgi:hypothetical protein